MLLFQLNATSCPRQSQKIIPSKKKLVAAQHKNRPSAKLNSRKNFVQHGKLYAVVSLTNYTSLSSCLTSLFR